MSRPESKYKPILPAPSPPESERPELRVPGGYSADNSASSRDLPPRKKRTGNVRFACNGCRAKKSACDEQRPSCSACLKRGSLCAYSTQQSSADLLHASSSSSSASNLSPQETESQRKRREVMEELLNLLRSLPESASIGLLSRLRSSPDASTALSTFKMEGFSAALESSGSLGHRDAQQQRRQLAVAVRPPAQDSLEFELMMRHPIAYPTLVPPDTTYFRPGAFPGEGSTLDGLAPEIVATPPGAMPPVDPRSDGSLSGRSTIARCSTNCNPGEPDTVSARPLQIEGHSKKLSCIMMQKNRGLTKWGRGAGLVSSFAPSIVDPFRYCDERLAQANLRYWTDANISGPLAAYIISLYLETDHPVLGLFDADLFLDDLIAQRDTFCSRLLVNSVLCWGCQTYGGTNPDAILWGLSFYDEAKRLCASQQGANSLTVVASAQLLCLAALCYGKDEDRGAFLRVGLAAGKSLHLWAPSRDGAVSRDRRGDDRETWLRATCHTAWGAFGWITLHSFQFHSGELERPPALPIPGEEESLHEDGRRTKTDIPERAYNTRGAKGKTRESPARALPAYMGTTFTNMCRLWTIIHDVVWNYYDVGSGSGSGGTSGPSSSGRGVTPAERASLEFAEETYLRLLSWADSLPMSMARGRQSPHHVLIAHIYYHAAVVDLFRPFLPKPWSSSSAQAPPSNGLLRSFAASDRTPGAVCAASIQQLKQLILTYRARFLPSAASSAAPGDQRQRPPPVTTILWHTALLYVANAMLRDAMREAAAAAKSAKAPAAAVAAATTAKAADTTDGLGGTTARRGHNLQAPSDGWKPWFLLCIAGYRDLYPAFRVVDGVVQGLLGMALRDGVMALDEMRTLIDGLRGVASGVDGLRPAGSASASGTSTSAGLSAAGSADGTATPDGDAAATGRRGGRGASGVAAAAAGEGPVRATFMVDLDLAMTDPMAASVERLAERFGDLAMFDDLTTLGGRDVMMTSSSSSTGDSGGEKA